MKKIIIFSVFFYGLSGYSATFSLSNACSNLLSKVSAHAQKLALCLPLTVGGCVTTVESRVWSDYLKMDPPKVTREYPVKANKTFALLVQMGEGDVPANNIQLFAEALLHKNVPVSHISILGVRKPNISFYRDTNYYDYDDSKFPFHIISTDALGKLPSDTLSRASLERELYKLADKTPDDGQLIVYITGVDSNDTVSVPRFSDIDLQDSLIFARKRFIRPDTEFLVLADFALANVYLEHLTETPNVSGVFSSQLRNRDSHSPWVTASGKQYGALTYYFARSIVQDHSFQEAVDFANAQYLLGSKVYRPFLSDIEPEPVDARLAYSAQSKIGLRQNNLFPWQINTTHSSPNSSPNSSVFRFFHLGDFNRNNVVDMEDLQTIGKILREEPLGAYRDLDHFIDFATQEPWFVADVRRDAKINLLDYFYALETAEKNILNDIKLSFNVKFGFLKRDDATEILSQPDNPTLQRDGEDTTLSTIPTLDRTLSVFRDRLTKTASVRDFRKTLLKVAYEEGFGFEFNARTEWYRFGDNRFDLVLRKYPEGISDEDRNSIETLFMHSMSLSDVEEFYFFQNYIKSLKGD